MRLSLTWRRCRTPCRIEHRPPTEKKPGDLITVLSPDNETDNRTFIVRTSDDFEEYDPFTLGEGLHRILAWHDPTPEGAKEFIDQYGFPTDSQNIAYPAGQFAQLVLSMRQMLELLDHRQWESLVGVFASARLGACSLALETLGGESRPQPRIVIRATNLAHAMWIQFAKECDGNLEFKVCEYCRKPFAAGAGTSQGTARRDARFCSRKCANAFNYHRRKEAKL